MKKISIKLHKIRIEDRSGTFLGEIHIPKKCDQEFEYAIIRFLDAVGDHNALKKCCKLWGATYSRWQIKHE